MNFEAEKAKLLEEKAALAQKGLKQKLTAKDDTASKRRASALEPAAVEARKQSGEWRLRLCSVVCGPLSALGCF